MDAPAVLDCGAGLCLGHWRGVLLTLLRRPIEDAHLVRIRRQVEALGGRSPARVAALVVLEAGALGKAPSPSVRAGLDALRRELPPFAAALVVEGAGLRVAAVRLLLAGILAAARATPQVRGFDDARAAARWLASAVAPGEAGAAGSIEALVAQSRAALDATL